MYFAGMGSSSDTTVQTWIRLVRAYKTALSSIEKALKEQGLPPLSWYDVLLELERAGKQGLRPFELEPALLLPQYGVSRLVGRLEAAGYVERLSCEGDKRGQCLIITPSGKELRRNMWAIYGKALEQAVGCKLSRGESKKLSALLRKLEDADNTNHG